MAKPLSLLDLGFLAMEGPNHPAHVGSLTIIDIPEGYKGNYARDLYAAYRDTGPAKAPFNWRVEKAKLKTPKWVEVEDFNLDQHVHFSQVTGEGNREDVAALVARLHEKPLDMAMPLWDLHFIEGIDGGKKFGQYSKIHHALVDGMASIQIRELSFSNSKKEKPTHALWNALDLTGEERQSEKIGKRVLGLLQQSAQRGKAMRSGLVDAVPDVTRSLLKQNLKKILGHDEVSPPFTGPKTIFNVPVSSRRSYAYFSMSLPEVKAVSKKLDASLNEGVMALCSTAIRRYLLEKDALPKAPLCVGMPISVRAEGDAMGGNRVGLGYCNLATDVEDPLERLQTIVKSSAYVKKDFSGMSSGGAMAYSSLTQGLMVAATKLDLVQYVSPFANVVISNVPGLRTKKYAMGGEVLAAYPMSMLVDGGGLNITLVSYVDRLDFGILACRKALPDVQLIADYIQDAFKELQELAG
jgi:diacylglycerol O-acyltransferase